MSLFQSLSLVVFASLLSQGAEVAEKLDKIMKTESGYKWCPAPKIGVECPAPSAFHYYKCCGDTLNQCCLQVQTWVVVVLIVLGILLLSTFLLLLIRCLLCRRK